jgi:hypothetical protein
LVRRRATGEQVGFPPAAQIATGRRKSGTRQRERVYLVTSCPHDKLGAEEWLQITRQGWGIENGLHLRLDVTAMEDRCRVRTQNAAWVLGMFRRLSISLYAEWKSRDPTQTKHKTYTDFLHAMSYDNHRKAFNLVNSLKPSLKQAS